MLVKYMDTSTRDETVHIYLMGDDTDTLPRKVVMMTRGTREDNLLEVRQAYMNIGWVRTERVSKKRRRRGAGRSFIAWAMKPRKDDGLTGGARCTGCLLIGD
jgi:hypothetical protein